MTDMSAELAEVLSPSQLRFFMDCQVRWWFKYALKLPDPQTARMALGKAVHAALNENFAQKIVADQVNNSIDAQKTNIAHKRQLADKAVSV